LLREARYNRIEGLSLGLRGALDLGRLRVEGHTRLGLADLEPNGELVVVRETPDRRYALGGYHRLTAANPGDAPFGAMNSAMAFFFGRDDGHYFRATGLELVAQDRGASRWAIRLFHEDQREALVETDFSLPGLFSGDPVFRPNFLADRAVQSGAEVVLRAAHPLSQALTVGTEVMLDAGRGDFAFERGAVTARATIIPTASRLSGALSVSAGTSHGAVPAQSLFRIGGPNSVRGYATSTLAGRAFWTARGEIARGWPAVRLIGFVDAGSAGTRLGFDGPTLLGVGVGASFLDGLVRFDIARGIKAPRGTRLEIYLDGLL
jgi:hypothetical protein